MIPTIGQNDKDGTPYEDRVVYMMMIYQKHYALVTELDLEEGKAYGFIRWEMDDKVPGKWDTFDLANMLDMGWIPLEFKTPTKFGEAINIAEEYYEKTATMEEQMTVYAEYTHGLEKKVSKLNL